MNVGEQTQDVHNIWKLYEMAYIVPWPIMFNKCFANQYFNIYSPDFPVF